MAHMNYSKSPSGKGGLMPGKVDTKRKTMTFESDVKTGGPRVDLRARKSAIKEVLK